MVVFSKPVVVEEKGRPGSRDTAGILDELGSAMAASVECCPELVEVVRLSRSAYANTAPVFDAATLGGRKVATRKTLRLGLETVSLVNVACGEAVIAERAIVDWGGIGRRDRDAAALLRELKTLDWSLGNEEPVARQLAAFGRETPANRAAALALYFFPLDNLPAASLIRKACKAAHERFPSVPAEDFETFVLVADSNSTGEAIFERVSRCQHSCAPNCSVVAHGCGTLGLYALKPLKAGEVLTFAYQGNSSVLMLPAVLRRRSLATLGFRCACARCELGVDDEAPPEPTLALAAARICVRGCGLPAPEDFDAEAAWACFKDCRVANGATHWSTALLALALLDAGAARFERTRALRLDVFSALACDTLTWFAENAELKGSLLHGRAFFAVNYVASQIADIVAGGGGPAGLPPDPPEPKPNLKPKPGKRNRRGRGGHPSPPKPPTAGDAWPWPGDRD